MPEASQPVAGASPHATTPTRVAYTPDRLPVNNHRHPSRSHASVYRVSAIAAALAGVSLASRSASTTAAVAIAAVFLLTLLSALIPRAVPSVAAAISCAVVLYLIAARPAADMTMLDRHLPLAILLVTWLLARQRRRSAARSERQHAAAAAIAVLDSATGEIRLTEEVERAGKYARPLSLVRLSFCRRTPDDIGSLSDERLRHEMRALVSKGLRGTDIPFDDGSDALIAILTETPAEDAWIVVARFSDAVERTRFREADEDRSLRDEADIRFAVAGFPEHGATATALLASLRRASADGASTATAAPE